MRNDLVRLIVVKEKERDKDGFISGRVEVVSEVYAEKKSVTFSEFYEAERSNHKARYIFAVDPVDFDEACADGKEPEVVEHDGVRYSILRGFLTKRGELELTVEVVK